MKGTPLGFVPKQTYEASEVSQTPEQFTWFLALRFSLARFGFSESRPRRRSMLMFWIICVVSGSNQNPSTSRLTSRLLVGFIFGHFNSLRSPSYRKPIEHLSLAISGFPMSASNSAIARSGHL